VQILLEICLPVLLLRLLEVQLLPLLLLQFILDIATAAPFLATLAPFIDTR
jgi:hypothetical protein